MREVNTRIAQAAFDTLRGAGHDVHSFTDGLNIRLDAGGRVQHRIDWDDWAEFFDRVTAAVGGPEAAIRLWQGVQQHIPEWRELGALFVDPLDYGHFLVRNVFPRMYPHVKMEARTLPERRLRFAVTIPEPYRAAEGWLYASLGSSLSYPTFFGLPPARGTWTVTPRSMVLEMEMPPSRTLGARLKRASDAFFAHGLAREFAQHRDEIARAYRDLQDAHARTEAHARRLAALDRIGQELSRHAEPDALAAALSALLREHVGPAALAVWLADGEGELRCLRREGEASAETTAHELVAGGRVVGRLEVGACSTPGGEELLRDLLPWVTIAMENARRLAAVEAQRARAEREAEARRRSEAALLAASEALPGAVFILGPDGGVEAANSVAAAELRADGAGARDAVRAAAYGVALAGTPAGALADAPAYEVTALPAAGYRLVVRRDLGREIARRLERAAAAWELTARQQQVLARLVRGLSNKDIAGELECADNTVEFHVTQILRKAGADSRATLVAAFWART